MPITPTYPGVYIEELPSNTHTITPAPTAIGAFIGYTHPFKTRNPITFEDQFKGGTRISNAVRIQSFTDYETYFGGFIDSGTYSAQSGDFGSVAHAVSQFFLNGGADCYVVGLKPLQTTGEDEQVPFENPTANIFASSSMEIVSKVPTDTDPITVEFYNIRSSGIDDRDNDEFDLRVLMGGEEVEIHTDVNVSDADGTANFVDQFILDNSDYITVTTTRLEPNDGTRLDPNGTNTVELSSSVQPSVVYALAGEAELLFDRLESDESRDITISIGNFSASVTGGPIDQAKIELLAGTDTLETWNVNVSYDSDVAYSDTTIEDGFIENVINTNSNFIWVTAFRTEPLGSTAFDATGSVELSASGITQGSASLRIVSATRTLEFVGLEPTDSNDLTVELSNYQSSGLESSVPGVTRTADVADLVVTHGKQVETFRQVNLSAIEDDDELFRSNYIETRINDVSQLIRVTANRTDPMEDTSFDTDVSMSLTMSLSPGSISVDLPVDGGETVPITALVPTHTEPITITVDIVSTTTADITVEYDRETEEYTGVELANIQSRINSASSFISVGSPGTTTDYDGSTEPIVLTISTTSLFDATDFTPVFQAESDLDKVQIFNIMVLPGIVDSAVLGSAIAFSEKKMAFMVLDPLIDLLPVAMGAYMTDSVPKSANAAIYYPYLKSRNLRTNDDYDAPPSGTVAGIFAKTDVKRGVWKSPAGLETTILGTRGVVDSGIMTNPRQGILNSLGVNCLRSFPNIGTVVYGARSLVSANPSYEQWKYVAVRRMALFIEQTMLRNLTWAVFEPNAEPLWAALRISVENFMSGLFSQNAFKGVKPSDAFEVICDSTTTTQSDIDNGIVYIVIKFAPLKPAEFVIVRIGQLAGQTQS